jgi:hypothetical protein
VAEFFTAVERLELIFPEEDALLLLQNPGKLHKQLAQHHAGHSTDGLFANALDMLYFWLCQPRAALAFRQICAEFSPRQRELLLAGQEMLTREKELTRMLSDGFAGKEFARPLAFYLANYRHYLNVVKVLLGPAK